MVIGPLGYVHIFLLWIFRKGHPRVGPKTASIRVACPLARRDAYKYRTLRLTWHGVSGRRASEPITILIGMSNLEFAQ